MTTVTNLAKVLRFAPKSEFLTQALVDQIANHNFIGVMPANEVANLNDAELAELLFDSSLASSPEIAGQIATEILDLPAIKRLAGQSNAPAITMTASTSSPSVTVNIPKDFSQMTLVEALEFVNNNKTDQGVQLGLLQRDDVRQVIRAAGTKAIFAATTEKLIDVTKTESIISKLLSGDPYRSSVDGVFLLNLGMVLGTQVYQYCHPIDGRMLASDMVDDLGLDFKLISIETFTGYVWIQINYALNLRSLKSEIQKTSAHNLYADAKNNGPITTQLMAAFNHAKNILRDPSALNVDIIYREATAKKSDFGDSPDLSRAKLDGSVADASQFYFFLQVGCEVERSIRLAKLSELRRSLAIESGASIRFQLGQQIGEEESKISALEKNWNLGKVRKLIQHALTNEDFMSMTQSYFPRVAQTFANGQTLSQRIGDLIDFAQRQCEIIQLLIRIQEANPNGFANFITTQSRASQTVSQSGGKYNLNIGTADSIHIGDNIYR